MKMTLRLLTSKTPPSYHAFGTAPMKVVAGNLPSVGDSWWFHREGHDYLSHTSEVLEVSPLVDNKLTFCTRNSIYHLEVLSDEKEPS